MRGEDAWHRHNRRDRQTAKGIVEAAKQGHPVPEAVVAAAKDLLTAHHGTDRATVMTWTATDQVLKDLIRSMTNLNSGTPNQPNFSSWGKGGKAFG